MTPSRAPVVAGSFYPLEPDDLKESLDDCFVTSPLGPQLERVPAGDLVAGMVPHAGYIYSGPCAAHFYARLGRPVRRVIVIGVNHHGRGQRAAISPWHEWQTPLGNVPVDTEFQDLISARVAFVKIDERPHREEHSIEVQLPFLQRQLEAFTFVPISLSHLDIQECAELGAAIAEACATLADGGHRSVILASSDLSHYLSPSETLRLDHLALQRLLGLDADGLIHTVQENAISMCGFLPVAVMLFAARCLGAQHALLLKHYHSGEVKPMGEVVGYASVAVER